MSLPAPPPSQAPEPSKPLAFWKKNWLLVLIAVLVVGVIGARLAGSANHSGSPGGSDLDQRTCEIARDIAGSFNVTDNLEESRQRVVDLYNGYGQGASPLIAAGIRDWSAGLTTGNLHEAAQGVSRVDAACASEGF